MIELVALLVALLIGGFAVWSVGVFIGRIIALSIVRAFEAKGKGKGS